MQFNKVIAQDKIKNTLVSGVKGGRVPHAIMLLGPQGNGGLGLALAYAQYLNCENPAEQDSCGECNSCNKIEKFIHPDIHFTYPVVTKKSGDKPISSDYIEEWRKALVDNTYMSENEWLAFINAENKQGNITARECGEIIKRLNLKAFEAKYKVQIIWKAEHLSREGNRLLKILEEPPPNTLFILVCENQDQILNTIISRVQVIRVPKLRDADVLKAMVENHDLNEIEAQRISRVADGNFNLAMQLTEGDNNEHDELLMSWLGTCFNTALTNSPKAIFGIHPLAQKFADLKRERQKGFFKYSLFFLRECVRLSATGVCKLEGRELDFANKVIAQISIEQIGKISELINNLHYYIERNANPKILFFSNTLKVAKIIKNEHFVEFGV